MVKEEVLAEQAKAISEYMSKEVVTAKKSDTLLKVVTTMAEKVISCVVVVNDDREPIGILTERDLIKKVAAKGEKAGSVQLADVMNAPVFAVDPDTSIVDVSNLMHKKKVRRFPVVEDGNLVGIITETDVIRGLIAYIKHLNWCVVEKQISKTAYEKILRDIKLLVSS